MDDTIDLKQLNDLREAVLRGEDIPPERYHEVLLHVQKLRRDVKSSKAAQAPQIAAVDFGKLLFGKKEGS